MIDAKEFNNEINQKWNALWSDRKVFHFKENDRKRTLFVIDTPPPFTTGELHMGQTFWVCYIDAIARYKHLRGFNVLYPQGWDTQGFPTEILVEKKFGRGMGRKEFYDKCTEISKANIVAMTAQMRKLGATFDERRSYATMTEEYRAKVQLSLLMMLEKNFVYRAKHPVEWCVHCGSSIAREETVEKNSETLLNYLKFGEGKEMIEIATTRPEYLHACVAVAVNPTDDRFKTMVGKSVQIPLFKRKVKVIADQSIEKDYGTGAEMVCTFGDKNDSVLFYRHSLELIEAIDEKGNLINAERFTGMTTKAARKEIIEDLRKAGLLIKQERKENVVKVHDRCKTPIEIRSALQWFIRTKEHAEKIKEFAAQIGWIPEGAKQRLDDWANFIEWDWNISRRRIFGTPIPFWFCEKCDKVVAPTREELPVNPALDRPKAEKCECGGRIVGETDTCDVWIDSSITPLVIAGWPDDKELFAEAFPASMRIQGTDIIRTWAFYTIMRTMALTDDKPWENILTHGMILGTDGKEMHKSDGNGISPDQLLEKYTVDAIRLWVALSGGIGKDKAFSYEEMDYAKGFLNKLYNSALFVQKGMAEIKYKEDEVREHFGIFDLWILNRFNKVIKEVTEGYDRLNLYEAMNKLMTFYWHEFADYYIENVKYRVYSEEKHAQQSREAATYVLRHILFESVKMFAPVIPYIAEEINAWFSKESVFESQFPASAPQVGSSSYVINGLVFKSGLVDADYEDAGAMVNRVIADVRKFKASNRLALNKEIASIEIMIPEQYYGAVSAAKAELKGICKTSEVKVVVSKEYLTTVRI